MFTNLLASFFATEEVTVRLITNEVDELGEPTETATEDVAADVLVSPGATSDLDATRPNGVRVSYTLHFPKTWARPLRGAKVRVRGTWLDVVGEPAAYTAANTPGPFNMQVEVGYVHG